MKKLNFDLTVNSSALLCPNPQEWFSKAYLDENVADNYRLIPGVKTSTKVANTNFTSILKAEDCDFTASANILSAVTFTVCPLQAQVQICKKDIESSFVSLQMAKGSSNWDVASFMNHYWEAMSAEVKEEIEYIRWVGSTTNTGYTGVNAFKALCDGYEKLLAADAQVIDVAASGSYSAVTVANVIDIMGAMLVALPAAALSKKKELRFYAASNVVTAFTIAAAKGNTLSYITEALGMNFVGIKIVEAPGMTSNKIVLTRKDNLVYLFDGENDATELKAINLTETTGQPLLRTAAYLKVGFGLLNPQEIVYFS